MIIVEIYRRKPYKTLQKEGNMPKTKWKKNRFAGADAIYSTKKYYVREDVSNGKDGQTLYSKRYIKRSPRATKEVAEFRGMLLAKTKNKTAR